MEKDFDAWNRVKKQLDGIEKPPFFNQREIWWCSVGLNIGSELYGKGRLFTRPVLVLHKQGRYTFLGAPMSTKLKERKDYYQLNFKGEMVSVLLQEIRKYDARRLADKMGKVSEGRFSKIQKAAMQINFQPQ